MAHHNNHFAVQRQVAVKLTVASLEVTDARSKHSQLLSVLLNLNSVIIDVRVVLIDLTVVVAKVDDSVDHAVLNGSH